MPSKQNLEKVEKFKDLLKKTQNVVFVDYRGLEHSRLEELRNSVEKAGGQFKITKNTLLSLALKEVSFVDSPRELVGPTATVFLQEDLISPIKVLDDFIAQYDLPVVKGGIFNHKYVSEDQIQKIADLSSQEELYTKLLARLQLPLRGLLSVLQGTNRNLFYVLRAIRKAKGGEVNG